MSDGKEYISYKIQFVENTPHYLSAMTEFYDCGQKFNILLESEWVTFDAVVDGRFMFYGCGDLKEFDHPLPNLVDGRFMFSNCIRLKHFNQPLLELVDGANMFEYCKSLREFDQPLPELVTGRSMFEYCTALSKFKSSLPKLVDGGSMFDGCRILSDANEIVRIALILNRN